MFITTGLSAVAITTVTERAAVSRLASSNQL
jgi:hypothetical protein